MAMPSANYFIIQTYVHASHLSVLRNLQHWNLFLQTVFFSQHIVWCLSI